MALEIVLWCEECEVAFPALEIGDGEVESHDHETHDTSYLDVA